MPTGLILAIDQGTTNTKALLVSRSGVPVFHASAPVALMHSAPGRVEQDLDRLWASVLTAISDCLLFVAQSGSSIEALAISNQRETAVAWNAETGAPVGNAISWQCGCSQEVCRRLEPKADLIRARTGLPLATLISAGKWAWLLENDASAARLSSAGTLRLGTIDSWLIHRLTSGKVHATDLSNASRTGLLDLKQLRWNSELLQLFGISPQSMPELRASSGSFGICNGIAGLDGVPILAAIGDSHAALFCHGRYAPGTVKATYGTGSSLMALTRELPGDTPLLARTIAWSIADETQFALEGNIAMTGSAVQWVGEFLNLAEPAQHAAALATTASDAGGVYFVPAMVGLGAPYWDAAARGAITGLGRSHTSAHLARAAIDAIAYQIADVFWAMEQESDKPFAVLLADGGATRNSSLMQFQADILGRPVLRSDNEELSALGAGWLAGLAMGWWRDRADLATLPRQIERFTPAMKSLDRERLYAGWKIAVQRARLKLEATA